MADKIKVDVEVKSGKAEAALASIDDRLTGFTETVKEAAGTMRELVGGFAEFAVRVEQQNRALQSLGRSYDLVSAATNGTITAQETLRAQQSLVQSGMQVNEAQFATLARAARDYALATGTETTQALEQLTDALQEGSADGLNRFGLAASASADRTQTLANAVRELEQRQRGAAPAARTLAEDIAKIGPAMQELGGRVMDAVSGPLNDLFEKLTGLMGVTVSLRRAITELASSADDLRALDRLREGTQRDTARQEQRTALVNTLRRRGFTVDLAGAGLSQLSQLSGEQTAALSALARRASSQTELDNLVRQYAGGVRTQIDADRAREAAARETAASVERKQRKLGDAAQGAANGLNAVQRALAGSLAGRAGITALGADEFSDMLGQIAAPSAEELAAEDAQRGKAEAAFAEQRAGTTRDRERFQRISARDRETRRRARTESFGGELASALGYETDDEGRIKGLDAQKAGVGMLQSAVQTLQGNLSQLFNTIVSGSMSAADAFQLFASRTLSSLGEMAMNKGLFYTFEGVASLFSNPPAAPLYFAAGAGLLALGAGLGYAGAAIAPQSAQSTGAASTGAARAASGSSRGSLTQEQAAPVTVVMSSLVPAGPADAQRARDGLRHARRQGFDDRLPRRVEF